MISKIELSNFKCFDELSLPLKNVTVLTGINGMGKSTIIQSLLLLRQSFLEEGTINGLHLNGKYIELGNMKDILYEKAENEIISIGYSLENGKNFRYNFRYKPSSDYIEATGERSLNLSLEAGNNILFDDGFIYLSAFRIKPQDLYHIINLDELAKKDFGNNGEYALQYLQIYGNENVENEKVIIDDKYGNSLFNQTKLWMGKIAPGVSPQVFINMELRYSELRYEFIEGKEKTNSYKSVNVGFGITYVLPLVVALLSAKRGDIVLLENPEAHIHPSGQRVLGELIALAGAGGVQVIVETHSDHVINGIRLFVKHNKIEREQVKLAFFYKDIEDAYKHKYCSPEIQDDGRLDFWPEGFFDEWDKALYDLL